MSTVGIDALPVKTQDSEQQSDGPDTTRCRSKRKRPPPVHKSMGMDLFEKDAKTMLKAFLDRYLGRRPVTGDYWYDSTCTDGQFTTVLHCPCFTEKLYYGTPCSTKLSAELSAADAWREDNETQEAAARLPATMSSIKYWTKAMRVDRQGRSIAEHSRQQYMDMKERGCRTALWDGRE